MNHKRIDAIDSNKIKRYCTSKEQKNKQAAVWGKNSQNISHTELTSRYEIYKELLQVNNKNISKPIKNKRKTLTGTSKGRFMNGQKNMKLLTRGTSRKYTLKSQ